MCVCELTEVNPILGAAPSLGDPAFAAEVLIGSKRADEVGPQGAQLAPELKDGQRLLRMRDTPGDAARPWWPVAVAHSPGPGKRRGSLDCRPGRRPGSRQRLRCLDLTQSLFKHTSFNTWIFCSGLNVCICVCVSAV